MKRIWIQLLLITFACNEAANEKSYDMSPLTDEEVIAESYDMKPSFTLLNIIEEKLQESYDITHLAKHNTNFKTHTKSSTLKPKKQVLKSLESFQNIKVSNLVQIGDIEKINDSITHIKFAYSLKSQQSNEKDTLKAIIKKKELIVDGIITTSIKIDFADL